MKQKKPLIIDVDVHYHNFEGKDSPRLMVTSHPSIELHNHKLFIKNSLLIYCHYAFSSKRLIFFQLLMS